MLRLVRMNNNKWRIETKTEGIFEGNLSQVFTFSILRLGISFMELEFAVSEMNFHGHNIGYFGVRKSFIFSAPHENKVG